jgi:hypothetical protein
VSVSIDIRIADVTGFPEEGRERVAIREAGERKVTVQESIRARRASTGMEKNARVARSCSWRTTGHRRGTGSGVCDLPLLRGLIDSMVLGALCPNNRVGVRIIGRQEEEA